MFFKNGCFLQCQGKKIPASMITPNSTAYASAHRKFQMNAVFLRPLSTVKIFLVTLANRHVLAFQALETVELCRNEQSLLYDIALLLENNLLRTLGLHVVAQPAQMCAVVYLDQLNFFLLNSKCQALASVVSGISS